MQLHITFYRNLTNTASGDVTEYAVSHQYKQHDGILVYNDLSQ